MHILQIHCTAQVSDFVENHVVASDVETWEDWFEMDANSEQRFLTMGEPLDPEGASVGRHIDESLRGCTLCLSGSCILLGCGLVGIGDVGIRWLSYRGKGTIKLMLTDLNLRAYLPAPQ